MVKIKEVKQTMGDQAAGSGRLKAEYPPWKEGCGKRPRERGRPDLERAGGHRADCERMACFLAMRRPMAWLAIDSTAAVAINLRFIRVDGATGRKPLRRRAARDRRTQRAQAGLTPGVICN